MNIGVGLNASSDGGSPHNAVDELVELAEQAAKGGLRSVWFGQRYNYDAVAMAAIVGRAVPGIAVGTSVVPIAGRHPLLLAAQAQTAQAATHGRYTLGLGVDTRRANEFVFGLPHHRPVTRLREFITVLRSVFETGEVDLVGGTLTARSPMSAEMAGADPVPILVAALGPQALRVAGELADGTLPFLASPKVIAEHIAPAITIAAQQAGRPTPRIAVLVPAVVTDEVEHATARAEQDMALYDTIPS